MAPTGRSPNAKRPLDRASIQVAVTGQRAMTIDDLTAGFYNLSSMNEKESKLLDSTAKAVEYNGRLLDALILRVNNAEAAMTLANEVTGKQTTAIDDLTRDVKLAVTSLEEGDKKKDVNLRQELDNMMKKLEDGLKELHGLISTSGTSSTGASPQPPDPQVPSRLQALEGNFGKLADMVSRAESTIQTMDSKVAVLEGNGALYAGQIAEIQAGVRGHAEWISSAARASIGAAGGSSEPAGATGGDSRGVDPMANGNDSWSQYQQGAPVPAAPSAGASRSVLIQ